MTDIFLILTVASLAALLVAEARGSRLGIWIAKPLASLGFLGGALALGALDEPYGVAIFVGLVLSFAGDVLLIPKKAMVFRLGIVSFLLAHVAYIAAFAVRGLALDWTAVALVPLVAVMIVVIRWLKPHLPREMKIPVYVYVVVISLMVAAAFGTSAPGFDPWVIMAGTLLFYLSDLAVARNRFVAPAFVNRAWGLPFYYAGQWLLVWSAATVV